MQDNIATIATEGTHLHPGRLDILSDLFSAN
jgi:hypothetical protein